MSDFSQKLKGNLFCKKYQFAKRKRDAEIFASVRCRVLISALADICSSSQSNLLELSENDKTQGTRISNQYGKETVNNNDRTDIMLGRFA
jgi:hypothetical protein